MSKRKMIDRRIFLKKLGFGALTTAATLSAAGSLLSFATMDEEDKLNGKSIRSVGDWTGSITYRINRHTSDKVSLLGYGCMRWPTKQGTDQIDQEKVNQLVDYAMAHGVNYYDTAPAYGDGSSETALGIAIHKYPRDKYYIATKMSNFATQDQSKEASLAMYNASKKRLQIDYIDYYLLHAIGMGGMDSFKARFINNGILDFLLNERKEGRIRNLGFSYHGDVEVFDYLLKQDIQWDFVQIELNYVDWKYAKQMNPRNTDAEYLYNELEKKGIQAIIMEPLLGGRLAKINEHLGSRLKAKRPNDSIASWAFRYAGSLPNVLTVLSGMTYLEHLQDNLHIYSPLDPCTSSELSLLENVAKIYSSYPMIPCTGCHYCMPCPFGLDIPANFAYYNKCVNDGTLPTDPLSPDYQKQVRIFLDGYNRSVPEKKQALNCAECGNCLSHCPQHIQIPTQMRRISNMVEEMKKVKLTSKS